MNTDNTAISGETLDYGPCAFLDEYDPDKKFSSIDHRGRYAFSNQPRIAHWNMARLAEALLPVLSPTTRRRRSASRPSGSSAFPRASRPRTCASCAPSSGSRTTPPRATPGRR